MSTPAPEDRIIERHMAHASAEEKEAARQNLRAFARVLLRIEQRLVREWSVERTRTEAVSALESEVRDPSQP
jgi:aminoglycoside/choline kinase family phosphotransferase